MKAYKLLWLADRYHLRQHGRTITGDSYYAIPFGIVPSDAKCLLENEKTKLKDPKGYKNKYLILDNHQYKAIVEPDLNEFSILKKEGKVHRLAGQIDALGLQLIAKGVKLSPEVEGRIKDLFD